MAWNDKTPGLRGFTLIELLVVISIIALLVAILMPALNKAREQAKMSVCASHQHQLVVAYNTYMIDSDGRLFPSISKNGNVEGNYHRPTELNWAIGNVAGPMPANPTISQKEHTIGFYMQKYINEVDVFNCAVSPVDADLVWPPPESGMASYDTYGNCYRNSSYTPLHSTNMYLGNYGGYARSSQHLGDKTPGAPFFEPVKTLASKNKLLIQDTLFYLTNNTNFLWYGPTTNTQNTGFSCHRFESSQKMYPYYTWKVSIQDFKDNVNMQLNAGYLDGHVESFNSQDTYYYKNYGAYGFITRQFK